MDLINSVKADYTNRETKLKFVFDKYKNILKGKILDVGADELYLKKFLPEGTYYVGVGFGTHPDLIKMDLEKDEFYFEDKAFDIVLCLDVLEHIENIHEIFDNLCRVSNEWVIISLPNPWATLMNCLQYNQYKPGRNTKFYGLPLEREDDRHKWFFSSSEAKAFVAHRANKNGFKIFDLYTINAGFDGLPKDPELAQKHKEARKLLFRNDLDFTDLYEETSWWVLKRKS